MKYFIFLLLLFCVYSSAFAGIRDEADMLAAERKQSLLRYSVYREKFRKEFYEAIDSGSRNEFVGAYEDFRETVGYWNECWEICMTAAFSLFDGEVKFVVVPCAIEEMDVVYRKIMEKYKVIRSKVDSVRDEGAKNILKMLLDDYAKERLLVEKYFTFLSNH